MTFAPTGTPGFGASPHPQHERPTMDMPATAERRPAALPIAVTLLLLVFLLFGAGCSGSGEGGGNGGEADSSAAAADSASAQEETEQQEEKAIRVDVGEVRRGNLVMPVYADGAIRTPRSVEIKTKVGGELLEVLVRDGDRVRKGQVMARIDPREYEIALQEARYRHLQALSQMAAEADTFTVNTAALREFAVGRDDLERAFKRGTITRDEYQARLLELEMGALDKGAFRDAVFQQRTGLAEGIPRRRLARARGRRGCRGCKHDQ